MNIKQLIESAILARLDEDTNERLSDSDVKKIANDLVKKIESAFGSKLENHTFDTYKWNKSTNPDGDLTLIWDHDRKDSKGNFAPGSYFGVYINIWVGHVDYIAITNGDRDVYANKKSGFKQSDMSDPKTLDYIAKTVVSMMPRAEKKRGSQIVSK